MAIITNELSVAQGFGTLQKVFNMTAGQAIRHGMVCSLSNGSLVKGFSGAGMAYVAQNDFDNTDAAPLTNSFIGNGIDNQIVVIPVTCAGEIELPVARITGSVAVNDELVADSGTAGKWIKLPTSEGSYVVIGTVTEVTDDFVLVLLEKTPRTVAAATTTTTTEAVTTTTTTEEATTTTTSEE